MDAPIYDLSGARIGTANLPSVFRVPYRPDVIHRVFWALFTHTLQPKGVDPMAGKKTSAESWGVGRGVLFWLGI